MKIEITLKNFATEALESQIKSIKVEAEKAAQEGDLDATEILIKRIKDIREQIESERKRLESTVSELVKNGGPQLHFLIKPGEYYSGWYEQMEADPFAIYTRELTGEELAALQILCNRQFQQARDGRLFYTYPEYRDTCWGQSSGTLTAKALHPKYPVPLEEISKRKAAAELVASL